MKLLRNMFIIAFLVVLSGCVVVTESDIPTNTFTLQLSTFGDPYSIIMWNRQYCGDLRYVRYNQPRRCFYYNRHDPRYHYGNCAIVVDRFGRYTKDCRPRYYH